MHLNPSNIYLYDSINVYKVLELPSISTFATSSIYNYYYAFYYYSGVFYTQLGNYEFDTPKP